MNDDNPKDKKDYCQYHKEKYQELWPGEWLCESCLLEATQEMQFDNDYDYEIMGDE